MQIYRSMHRVKIGTYTTTPDSYGQPRQSIASTHYVEMSITPYSQSTVQNPTYIDCQAIGLTKDNSLSTKDCVIDGAVTYDIVYIISGGRFNQVLLRVKK